jgi:hypothetical protein
MTRRLMLALAALLIMATACSALPGDQPGSIAMVPFSLPDVDVQGMVPSACSQVAGVVFACEQLPPGEGLLVLTFGAQSLSRQEIEEVLLQSLGLDALPEVLGSYRGRSLTWQLQQVDSVLQDQGLPPPPDGGPYRVDVALAEAGGQFYVVGMITLPVDQRAHAAFYDALFRQVLYTLTPLSS